MTYTAYNCIDNVLKLCSLLLVTIKLYCHRLVKLIAMLASFRNKCVLVQDRRFLFKSSFYQKPYLETKLFASVKLRLT